MIVRITGHIFIPSLSKQIRHEKTIFRDDEESGKDESAKESYQKILSDKRFYFIIPAAIMPPFWVTGLFLYQVSAAESLGWTAGLIASAFIAFALSRIMAGIMTGPMIDRFSARSEEHTSELQSRRHLV